MPRLGFGTSSYTQVSRARVLDLIQDRAWDQFSSGEIMPKNTATRKNFLLYSQDVSQSNWTKSNTSIPNNTIEAPNNTSTAQAITGAANTSVRETKQTVNIVAGTTYTYSVYVKAGNFSHVRLFITDGSVVRSQDFNCSTGAVGTTHNLSSAGLLVIALDNGWFRFSITFQCVTSSEEAPIGTFAMAANNTTNVQVAVSGTVLINVWAQQFEESSIATGYISTAASAKTANTVLQDLNSLWDFDGTNLMPEASPSAEGLWELPAEGELATNGSFTTDSNWTKSNTTISNGVLNFASSGSAKYAFQDSVVEPGVSYVIKLTVVRTSGTLKLLFGTSGSGVSGISDITDSGNYTFTTPPLTSTEAGSGRFWAGYTSASDNFVGTVDNVSVTEYAIIPKNV